MCDGDAGMELRPPRRARLDDAEAFATVMSALAAERDLVLSEPPVDEVEFAERYRETFRSERGDRFWVLEDGDPRVVGTLGLQPAHRAPGVLSLGMGLIAEARGRGGGRALLDAGLEDARQAGAHKVELEVFTTNARAISLYASCGFELEGIRRDHYRRRDGSLRSVLLMARLLG